MLRRVVQSRFIRDNSIYMAGVVMTGIFGYLFHFMVSRSLSVSQYGELQSLMSLLTLMTAGASCLTYLILKYVSVFSVHYDYAATKQFLNSISIRIYKWGALALLVYFLLFSQLKRLLHVTSTWELLAIGLTALVSLLFIIQRDALQAWRQFYPVSVLNIFAAFLKLLTGFAMAYYFQKASAVAFSFLITGLLTWWLAKRYARSRWGIGAQLSEGKVWKEKYFQDINIKKTFYKIALFSLAIALLNNIDMILVKNLTSAEITGYYGALSTLGKIVLWLNLGVVGVLLPSVCSEGSQDKSLSTKTIQRSYILILLISCILIVLYFIFSKMFVEMLFGPRYLFYARELWLFGIASFVLSVLILEANLAFARNDFKVTYLMAGIIALTYFGLNSYNDTIHALILALIITHLVGYLLVVAYNYRKIWLPWLGKKNRFLQKNRRAYGEV